ncbi:MAG: hypothetical protein AAB919_00260 [Patescibacteria group bacterium]
MQKLSHALSSNLHIILAAVIGVLGALVGSYLSSTYSSDNTARDWKRLAYSNVVSEAMYLAPQNLLLPAITDRASCEVFLKEELTSVSLLSENEKREGVNKIEKAFGVAILLAETPLRKKLIEFRKTINAALYWRSLSIAQIKGLMRQNSEKKDWLPTMESIDLCGDKELHQLTKRYSSQEELLKLMRNEIGLK